VGIATDNPGLVARSYRSPKGITVLYFAKEALKGRITVDPSALGFPGKPAQVCEVNLAKNEPGYRVITP